MNTRSLEALVEEFNREHPFTSHEADLLRLVRAAYTLGYTAAEVDNWIPNP